MTSGSQEKFRSMLALSWQNRNSLNATFLYRSRRPMSLRDFFTAYLKIELLKAVFSEAFKAYPIRRIDRHSLKLK